MPDDVFDLLKTLCAIPGPVGREEMVQEYIQDQLKNYCSDVKQDKIGNLTATIEGTGKHYAVVAHADEVGFFVSNIDKNGFVRAKWNTQGYEPDMRLLPGQWVLIMSDSGLVPGCFCVKTAHIAGPEGKKKLPKWDDVFIDIGLNSPEEVEALGIHVGSPVIYAASVEKVGHNIMGKSFDDRVGLAMMIQLAKRLAKIPVEKRPRMTFVSTVMEEIGAKGAAAIAKSLDVDGAIILDIGLADDYPGTKGEAGVKLGKGPVVVIKDSQIVYSHKQNQSFLRIAEEQGISVQRAVYHNFATDGFQIASQGQIVSVIGVPCRYSHSSFEAINLSDVESALQLVYNFLLNT